MDRHESHNTGHFCRTNAPCTSASGNEQYACNSAQSASSAYPLHILGTLLVVDVEDVVVSVDVVVDLVVTDVVAGVAVASVVVRVDVGVDVGVGVEVDVDGDWDENGMCVIAEIVGVVFVLLATVVEALPPLVDAASVVFEITPTSDVVLVLSISGVETDCEVVVASHVAVDNELVVAGSVVDDFNVVSPCGDADDDVGL